MFDVHEALLLRAGVPSVYNPQCFNSGPSGRCVRDLLGLTVLSFDHDAVRGQRGRTRLAQVRRRVL